MRPRTKPIVALTGALGLVFTVTACGGDEPAPATSTAATSGAGTGSGGGGGTGDVPCDGAPPELAMAGTWAAFGRLAVTFVGAEGGAITICPVDQVNQATLLLMIRIEQGASATELTNITATLCSIDLPAVTALVGDCNPASESLVSTKIIVPPALLAALPEIVTSSVDGTLGGAAPGASIDLGRFVVTVGSSAPGAALPSWDTATPSCGGLDVGHTSACETTCVDDCAALRDDDGDGYPGVTAEVCGKTPDDESSGVPCNASDPSDPGATLQGRASLGLEVDPKFTGIARSSCEIEGTVTTSVNYQVVGADLYLAGASIGVTSAIRSLPTFDVDGGESRFRMVRIDGRYGAPDYGVDPAQPALACAEIVTHVNEL